MAIGAPPQSTHFLSMAVQRAHVVVCRAYVVVHYGVVSASACEDDFDTGQISSLMETEEKGDEERGSTEEGK